MIKKYYIYRIINLINGKTYIGQHKYKKLNDDYMGSGKHLKAAQAKYGIENFKKEILVFNISKKEHIDLLEKTFIAAEREKVGAENCYNIADGGEGGNLGEEVIKKISEALRGRHLSEETKQKVGAANKGKVRTAAMRAYWSTVHKGKKHTEETKRNISEALKGRSFSMETRQLMSKIRRGKPKSEEFKARVSATLKGKPKHRCKPACNKGMHRFTNGIVKIYAFECPEGFRKGWR